MILSVPVAAVIKGVLVYWVETRTARPIFSEDGVLFRAAKDECAEADEARAECEVLPPRPRPQPDAPVDSHR